MLDLDSWVYGRLDRQFKRHPTATRSCKNDCETTKKSWKWCSRGNGCRSWTVEPCALGANWKRPLTVRRLGLHSWTPDYAAKASFPTTTRYPNICEHQSSKCVSLGASSSSRGMGFLFGGGRESLKRLSRSDFVSPHEVFILQIKNYIELLYNTVGWRKSSSEN